MMYFTGRDDLVMLQQHRGWKNGPYLKESIRASMLEPVRWAPAHRGEVRSAGMTAVQSGGWVVNGAFRPIIQRSSRRLKYLCVCVSFLTNAFINVASFVEAHGTGSVWLAVAVQQHPYCSSRYVLIAVGWYS